MVRTRTALVLFATSAAGLVLLAPNAVADGWANAPYTAGWWVDDHRNGSASVSASVQGPAIYCTFAQYTDGQYTRSISQTMGNGYPTLDTTIYASPGATVRLTLDCSDWSGTPQVSMWDDHVMLRWQFTGPCCSFPRW